MSLHVLSGGGISVVNWPLRVNWRTRQGLGMLFKRDCKGEGERLNGLGTEGEIAHWSLAGLEEVAISKPSVTTLSPLLADRGGREAPAKKNKEIRRTCCFPITSTELKTWITSSALEPIACVGFKKGRASLFVNFWLLGELFGEFRGRAVYIDVTRGISFLTFSCNLQG